ncbi:MAG: SAM-dependent methyltransferase [Sphingomicrobium sp.]
MPDEPPPAGGTESFGKQLRARIAADGPITVERFMALCNAHYYATRDPLGAAGDFTTAPEISQMFGEIVGAALADCWLRAGAPADACYAELGPGRGTLAADALKVLRKAGFDGAVHLVETSPELRTKHAGLVPEAQWHDAIDGLPKVPVLLVANEFFDALAVRQWVGAEERRVTLVDDRLAFTASGPVREDSPERGQAITAIAEHIAVRGGMALIVDYGHARTAAGDTLQAVRDHGFAAVLDDPGEQDLTAHIDFEALGTAARIAGVAVTPVADQGHWLERLGIAERASALAELHPQRAAEFALARERLCDARAMGQIFKVMAVHARAWPAPAGFAP